MKLQRYEVLVAEDLVNLYSCGTITKSRIKARCDYVWDIDNYLAGGYKDISFMFRHRVNRRITDSFVRKK